MAGGRAAPEALVRAQRDRIDTLGDESGLSRELRNMSRAVARLGGFRWLPEMLPRTSEHGEPLPRVSVAVEGPGRGQRAWPDLSDWPTFSAFMGWITLQVRRFATETERLPGSAVFHQTLIGEDWAGQEVRVSGHEDVRVLLCRWCLERGSLVFPAEPFPSEDSRTVDPWWLRPSPSTRRRPRVQETPTGERWGFDDLTRLFAVGTAMAAQIVRRPTFPTATRVGRRNTWDPDEVRRWIAESLSGEGTASEREICVAELGPGAPLLREREALRHLPKAHREILFKRKILCLVVASTTVVRRYPLAAVEALHASIA